jgi:hypothetical protein
MSAAIPSRVGLGPARIFRDEESYAVIRRTALLFGVPVVVAVGGI